MQQFKRADLDWANLPFGYIKTDCNIRYVYRNGNWSGGQLSSDDMILLNISAPCLHYGQQAFEGLKVFETVDGRIVAFRPDENARRLAHSCEAIYIPPVPVDVFIDAVHRVVAANTRFIPPYGTGASLYVRPLAIGTGEKLGLGPAPEYMFIVLVAPVGPYYKGGFKPVKALVVDQFDRTAPLGLGDCKVGGNYAASLRGGEYSKKMGYPIYLYLDPREKRFVDEFGTSNFIGIKGDRYITPASKSILDSITNKSLAVIAEDMGLTVERRSIEISELESFDEIGAVGTAAVITPISSIDYRGRSYIYKSEQEAGPVLTKLYNRLTGIQYGEEPDKFGWLDVIKTK